MKTQHLAMILFIAGLIFLFVGIGLCQQGGDGTVGKAEWANILKSKVSQPIGDKGLVNFEDGYIEAIGIGAPPERYYGKPQARPMALRAAQVDGYRNLLEIVQGVKIDSQTSVKDFVVENDSINAAVSGLVKGASVVKRDYLSDGTVEVTMRMRLTDVVKAVLPTSIANDESKGIEKPDPIPAPRKRPPAAEIFTGLVIDARGIGANAAGLPKILNENNEEVYGTLIASKDIVAKEGLCAFDADLAAAQGNSRVGSNPLTVKALRAEGTGMSDLKISNEDAQKILTANNNGRFLQKCRVIVVVEPPMGCVNAGTLVTLANGERKPIEELKVNDRITAFDLQDGKMAEARIEQVLKHDSEKYSLHQLKTEGNQELLITGKHPVFTKATGWQEVDQLKPGDVIYIFNRETKKMEEAIIAVIIRDQMEKDVVYNLKTSKGNYIANDIIIHNKCLKANAPIDTPSGSRAIEALKAGDLVLGQKDGLIKPVRVTNVYTKQTILPSLPGKQLSHSVAVTDNHLLSVNGKFVEAAGTSYPSVAIEGTVYDLQTEEGNYFSGGILMKAGN